MKERPILFKADMIRAILNTKPGVWPAEPIDPKQPFKWQTRRVIKPQPNFAEYSAVCGVFDDDSRYAVRWYELPELEKFAAAIRGDTDLLRDKKRVALCDYGAPGDHLWCRETWAMTGWAAGLKVKEMNPAYRDMVVYRADCDKPVYHDWRPSIFIPRWASRIDLEIKAIRVERVQEIGDQDVIAEGACIE